MKRLSMLGFAAAAAIACTSAIAQDEAPPAPMEKTTTTTTTTTWSVGPQERTVIHNYVVKENQAPAVVHEEVSIGAAIPGDVELQPVPEEIYSQVPEARRYQYFDWNGRMVFVDPDSRKVVQIVD